MRTRFIAPLVCSLVPVLLFAQAPKKRIARAADVPQFQYSINGNVEDLVRSEQAFRPFMDQVQNNVESVLRDYEIDDAATKRGLLSTLVAIDVLEGHDDDARMRLDNIKALEQKPAAKALSGLITRSILDARRESSDPNSPAYRKAVYTSLVHALDSLPFDVVQNDLKSTKAGIELGTESLLVGELQASFDPVVKKTGGLSSDLADALPGMRMMLVDRIPLRDTLNEALSGYLTSHTKEKNDIWASREVTLPPGMKYQPINVAVWDSGVDLNIFGDRVLKNSAGQPNILAYDIDSRKTTGNLYPLNAAQKARFTEVEKELKGLSDLQANVESPEATELKQAIAKLKPDQVKPFLEELSLFGNYAHGTHVAGILTAGNPYARLVVGRITFDWKMIPDPCPSRAQSERDAAAVQDYVNFFKMNKVRVVNMSWGGSVKDYEDGLEKCGIGKDIQERKTSAREFFDIEKNALEKAMLSAPEILFVAAAGNSNGDSTFQEAIPAALSVPNLLTVGAVDKAGDEASFTSYGPTVAVDANGYEVESYIPGGDRLKMSGTSMASPNVANLAAKILVVNPKLTPPQVIEIIRKTAEQTADGRRNLIDPKKAIAAAEKIS
ncbi:MAG: S8 family serine peptidase [Bryobacterales bacterium]|nr:S8 family serine peptidase [Bryobacterales bacterium]